MCRLFISICKVVEITSRVILYHFIWLDKAFSNAKSLRGNPKHLESSRLEKAVKCRTHQSVLQTPRQETEPAFAGSEGLWERTFEIAPLFFYKLNSTTRVLQPTEQILFCSSEQKHSLKINTKFEKQFSLYKVVIVKEEKNS